MFESIKRVRSYIKYHSVDKRILGREFILIVEQLWKLINNIYVAKWDIFIFDKEKTLTIKKCVGERIMPYYRQNQLSVKNEGSGLNIFLFFSFISIFFSIYFLYSIFRTRVRVRVTRLCCVTAGHIRWHDHKSHDIEKDVEDSRKMISYNV